MTKIKLKIYDLAKTAEKFNRRNYIDLLDKMDYQIMKVKGILPLLAIQSAIIITAFIYIIKRVGVEQW